VISVRDVYKSYGDVEVLAACSMEVRKGEVIVVCGPSGSGKSTLIKCINGLEPFERGQHFGGVGVTVAAGIFGEEPAPTRGFHHGALDLLVIDFAQRGWNGEVRHPELVR